MLFVIKIMFSRVIHVNISNKSIMSNIKSFQGNMGSIRRVYKLQMPTCPVDFISHIAYHLPKDDGDYQFCYVDSYGQVRGASTPFCFENPQDHTLYTSLENDILVISTKVCISTASSGVQQHFFSLCLMFSVHWSAP